MQVEGQYVRVATDEVGIGGIDGVKVMEEEGNAVKVRNGTGGFRLVRQSLQWQFVVVSGRAVTVMVVYPQEQLPEASMAVGEQEA